MRNFACSSFEQLRDHMEALEFANVEKLRALGIVVQDRELCLSKGINLGWKLIILAKFPSGSCLRTLFEAFWRS